MRAMFRITFRQTKNFHQKFTAENVIADNAIKAIQIASKEIGETYTSEHLFVSDVELLGVETVDH